MRQLAIHPALRPMPCSLLQALAVPLLLPLMAQGQDPASVLAVGVAGQVASVVVDKVRDKYENSELPIPCTGEECCQESACMNMPGMRCNKDRGPTKCVGSSAVQFREGTCACLSGPCSKAGKCGALPPGWAPSAESAAGAPPVLPAAPPTAPLRQQ